MLSLMIKCGHEKEYRVNEKQNSLIVQYILIMQIFGDNTQLGVYVIVVLVPRCYLNRFAETRNRKGKFYLSAHDKSNPNGNIFRVNIKNICVSNDFYTFNHLPKEHKRWLEKYYANNIEVLYNEIYEAFTNPKVGRISKDLKFKMVVYIVSQELRTDKLSKAMDSLFDGMLERSFLAFDQLDIEKKIGFGDGVVMDLEGKSLEQAKKESANENRQMVNLESLKRLKQIAELKMSNPIVVTRYSANVGLISSDRPVSITEPLYSPTCRFSLPIDHEHTVALHPSEGNEELDPLVLHKINHGNRLASYLVTAYNLAQLEHAERFVYGNRDDIEKTREHARTRDVWP